MRNKCHDYEVTLRKELKIVDRQEAALLRMASGQKSSRWKQILVNKVPPKMYGNLQKAFCKAFEVIFEKGTGIIEKTYNRESLLEDYEIHEFAFQRKADRKTLKKLWGDAKVANLKNMVVTSAEGIGLGVLGIGLPDILIFVGVLLKGIYELSLRYGFEYDSEAERYFILKLMDTAMLKGNAWVESNQEADSLMNEDVAGFFNGGTDAEGRLLAQIRKTADAFAVDMVVLKFIQGLPVVGIIGGAGNPLYYNKVMKYAEVKYRKRYLLKLQREQEERYEKNKRES